MEAFPTETFAAADAPSMAAFPPGGSVAFAADDGVSGEEIWVSGGDAASTFQLADILPGPGSSQPRQLTRVGRRIVFVADDGVHGRELWVASQDPSSATLLTDISPGLASSVPQHLTGFGGIALFSADDGVHGREPWVTDGSPQGTRRIADLAPGPLPSSPYSFTEVGGNIYFAATNAVSGFELWSFPRAALGLGYYTLPPCRAFDSRSGSPLLNGSTQTVPLFGVCGVPATAKAAAFNITAITPTGAGFLRAYPSSAAPTLVSQVNFSSGQTRTNNGIVEIGADGKIVVGAALTGGAVDFVFDVVGYFE